MERTYVTLNEKQKRMLKEKGSAIDSSGRLRTNGYLKINTDTLKNLKSLGRTKE